MWEAFNILDLRELDMIEALEGPAGLIEVTTEVQKNRTGNMIQECCVHHKSHQLLNHFEILVTVTAKSNNLYPIKTTEHGKKKQEKKRSP